MHVVIRCLKGEREREKERQRDKRLLIPYFAREMKPCLRNTLAVLLYLVSVLTSSNELETCEGEQ